jgi:hypothetical protein
MKHQIEIKSLVAGALLSAVAILNISAGGGDKDRTSWEYKIFIHSSEKIPSGVETKLTELGSLGWEAVGFDNTTSRPWVLLKRPKK